MNCCQNPENAHWKTMIIANLIIRHATMTMILLAVEFQYLLGLPLLAEWLDCSLNCRSGLFQIQHFSVARSSSQAVLRCSCRGSSNETVPEWGPYLIALKTPSSKPQDLLESDHLNRSLQPGGRMTKQLQRPRLRSTREDEETLLEA